MNKKNMKFYIKTFGCGLVLGMSNAIPGISGGTMAVVLNIFDKLLEALSIKGWKKHLDFLIPLVIGGTLGIFALSKIIVPLIDAYPMAVGFSFMGLIFGSLPIIARHALNDGQKPQLSNIVLGLFTLGIMITFSYIEGFIGSPTSSINWEGKYPLLCIILMVTSAISAIAMIIPGISGSLVMLMLGVYTIVIEGIANMDFSILAPASIGAVLGLVIGISGIKKAMTYFPQAMYFAILGLVIGSLWPVYPGFEMNSQGICAICCCLVFTVLSFWSSWPKK